MNQHVQLDSLSASFALSAHEVTENQLNQRAILHMGISEFCEPEIHRHSLSSTSESTSSFFFKDPSLSKAR